MKFLANGDFLKNKISQKWKYPIEIKFARFARSAQGTKLILKNSLRSKQFLTSPVQKRGRRRRCRHL